MSTQTKKSTPAILIRMDEGLRQQLKDLAHDNRKSLSAFLRDSLKDLLPKK